MPFYRECYQNPLFSSGNIKNKYRSCITSDHLSSVQIQFNTMARMTNSGGVIYVTVAVAVDSHKMLHELL